MDGQSIIDKEIPLKELDNQWKYDYILDELTILILTVLI